MAGLEDLYREIVLDHYKNPRNRGELESPPAHRSEGFNPLCGDEIVLYLHINDDNVIEDVKIGGQGCSISQSSASMMTAAIKGKSVEQAREVTSSFKALMDIHETGLGEGADDDQPLDDEDLGDLEAMRGVVKFPVRIKCATLSWNTMLTAFEELSV